MAATQSVRAADHGLAAAGTICLIVSALGAFAAPIMPGAAVAAVFGAAGLALTQLRLTSERPRLGLSLVDAAIVAAFVLARKNAGGIWQVPEQWVEVLRLSEAGSATACTMYFAAAIAVQARARRRMALRESLCLVLVPLMFNALLTLNSAGLMSGLGSALTLGLVPWQIATATLGRALLLFVFGEVFVAALGFIIAGRLPRDLRLHGLCLVTAVHAALGPIPFT